MKESGNPTQWGDIETGNPQPKQVEEDIRQGRSYVFETAEGKIAAVFFYPSVKLYIIVSCRYNFLLHFINPLQESDG